MLREGFDVEAVSNGWSIDLAQPFPLPRSNGVEGGTEANGDTDGEEESIPGSVVTLYEVSIQDPSKNALALAGRESHSTRLEVEAEDTQSFLAQQLKALESYRQKGEAAQKEDARAKQFRKPDELDSQLVGVSEHIGPVQFNMGGIQVDADDMVERIRVSLDPWQGHPGPDANQDARTDKRTEPRPSPLARSKNRLSRSSRRDPKTRTSFRLSSVTSCRKGPRGRRLDDLSPLSLLWADPRKMSRWFSPAHGRITFCLYISDKCRYLRPPSGVASGSRTTRPRPSYRARFYDGVPDRFVKVGNCRVDTPSGMDLVLFLSFIRACHAFCVFGADVPSRLSGCEGLGFELNT